MATRLKAAVIARNKAAEALVSLQGKHDTLTVELESLAAAVETAHATFKSVAGANAVGEVDAASVASARTAYRAAVSAFDEATIVAGGVGERVSKAEAALDSAEKLQLDLTSQLAQLIAARSENKITALAANLGSALAHHRALAQLASDSASAAAGTHVEPIDFSSASTPLTRHVAELMHAASPRITIDDLLAAKVDAQ
jgi:hypothetical protein